VTGAWTRDEASASGQVFEFRLWAALTEQSRGSLHPFLPLTDRGVDGFFLNPGFVTTDTTIPVDLILSLIFGLLLWWCLPIWLIALAAKMPAKRHDLTTLDRVDMDPSK